MEKEFFDFIKSFENKVVNLSKELSLANFNATISGKPEDYVKTAQLELKLKKIFSNKEDFEKIKEFKNSAEITDGVNIREIEVLYNSYASYQIDEELLTKTVELSNKIEQKFATYRAEVDGKKLTDNEIDKILEKSKNSEELEETWKALSVGTAGGSPKSSSTRQSSARARRSATSTAGVARPASMALTLWRESPTRSARATCDSPRASRCGRTRFGDMQSMVYLTQGLLSTPTETHRPGCAGYAPGREGQVALTHKFPGKAGGPALASAAA